jgi:hypothetical protein
MFLDTRNKNMYGLGVGISTDFKIFSNFPFQGVGLTPGVISLACNTRNENIYGLGVGISIDFKIFSQFPISGGGVNPRGHI